MDIQYKGVIAGLIVLFLCLALIIVVAQHKKENHDQEDANLVSNLTQIRADHNFCNAKFVDLNNRVAVLENEDNTMVVDTEALKNQIVTELAPYKPTADCIWIQQVGEKAFVMDCLSR